MLTYAAKKERPHMNKAHCLLLLSLGISAFAQVDTSASKPAGHNQTPNPKAQAVGPSAVTPGKCYRVLSEASFEEIPCPPEESTQSNGVDQSDIDTAVKAAKQIRNDCADPTSFALLEITTGPKGGCIHYVARNGFGGGGQLCGGYYFYRKGKLQVFDGDPNYAGSRCSCEGKGIDITDEVKAQLR